MKLFTFTLLIAGLMSQTTFAAKSRSQVGDAMRPKKSLSFDGRSIEAVQPGNYDSLSHLSEGGNRGARHLYDLPKDFSKRMTEDQSELRYHP